MILASAMLNLSRSGMFLSEGIAGVVYFLSGRRFPDQRPAQSATIHRIMLADNLLARRNASSDHRPAAGRFAVGAVAASPMEQAGVGWRIDRHHDIFDCRIAMVLSVQCPSGLAQWPY